jgi:xanthine dehydrogenase accessory factor
MIDAGSSVVIVTRSHQQDLDCLEYLLPLQPGYLGMIGSRRRVKLIREQLLACGYPEELLSRVCMPISLPIGAQTPEEIAVSIAAQLVAARRGLENSPLPPTSGGQQWKLLDKLVECLQAGRPVVAATVIRTSGSTPRKAGAKMLVAPDGSLEGTIGGGCAENEARREALALFHRGGCQLSR